MGSRRPRPLTLPAPTQPVPAAPKPNQVVETEETQPPVVVPPAEVAKSSKDPVCRITVDEESATAAGLTSTFKGRVYFFVSKECKALFDKDPAKYVDQLPSRLP